MVDLCGFHFISLVISDVEHFFMYHLDICLSSSEEHLFISSADFKNWINFFAVELHEFLICF